MQTNPSRDLSVSLLGFAFSTLFFLITLSLFIFTARLVTPEKIETEEIEYTLFLTHVPHKTAEGIKVGDAAVDAVKKGHIGRLTAVSVTPHKSEAADGKTLLIYEDPHTCDILLTLRASALADGRTVAGIPLYIGTKVFLRLPAYTGSGICISIKEASA